MLSDWCFATARLAIRPTCLADAEAVHLIRGTMPFDPPTRNLDATRAMIAAMIEREPDEPGWRQLAIVADGALIGDVGVNYGCPGPRQAEIGFALHPEVRRRGFGSEAVGAIVERLFARGLHRVAAFTDARNVATQRLLTGVRFRLEAHHVQSWRIDDEHWSDEYGYARLASD